MNDFFLKIKNSIDFSLRQWLKFSKKNYSEKNEPKEGLLSSIDAIEAEKRLVGKYSLEFLRNNSTGENYLENLYTIDLLDRYLPVDFSEKLDVLDVGCKNWFYAKAEYFFFKKHCKKIQLDGIELDSKRLYSNLYSRAEVAKFHLSGLNDTRYIEGDFLSHNEKYDYIVWFLPFVFEYPHLKWGLPTRYFKPEQMLVKAYGSLKNSGKIFVVNQGQEEFEEQIALCEKFNIPYEKIGKVESVFLTYKHPRYSLLIG